MMIRHALVSYFFYIAYIIPHHDENPCIVILSRIGTGGVGGIGIC
jgi:hypothetical protein